MSERENGGAGPSVHKTLKRLTGEIGMSRQFKIKRGGRSVAARLP
jgi:hypothetical protein